eukprot:148935_1
MQSQSPIRKLLSSRVAGLKVSPTVGINDISNQLIRENKKVYKFGLGQSPFPVPQCVVEALKNQAHRKEYLPAQGLLPLRESIADYHNINNSFKDQSLHKISPDDVIVGPGSKELIFLLQLAYYGELVLQSPCWVSYKPQADIIGRSFKIIRSKMESRWKITPKCLEEYLGFEGVDKPRVLVLNYPSNPTGVVYTDAELKALAPILREYQVIVISDEIYAPLNYKGEYHSISHFYPEGTIILNGISKWCGAGGYRLGYFVMPPSLHWLRDGMRACASETFTAVSSPISWAAITAYEKHFENEEIQEYLATAREVLKHVSDMTVDGLASYNLFSVRPDGGFYCFVNTNETKKGSELSDKLNGKDPITMERYVDKFYNEILRESGVAVLPGYHFQTMPQDGFFRLSFVDFDGAEALKNPNNEKVYDQIKYGVERIGQYMNS